MNQWWSGLNQREQRLLIIGGAALLLTLIYLLVVEPLFKHMQSLESSVGDQSELLQWMQESEQQINVLRRNQGNTSGRPAANRGGSLLALVDQTAKRSKLGEAIKRVEPEGSDGVRLWLEQASFDNILRWLAQIKQSQGVEVKRITIEQPDSPGIVNARISLTRGS